MICPETQSYKRSLQNWSFAQSLRYRLVEILEYDYMLWFQPPSGLELKQNPWLCKDLYKSLSQTLTNSIKEWDEQIEGKIQRILNEIEEVYQNQRH